MTAQPVPRSGDAIQARYGNQTVARAASGGDRRIDRLLSEARQGSRVVNTSSGRQYTVLHVADDGMLTIKGGLGDAPFGVYPNHPQYDVLLAAGPGAAVAAAAPVPPPPPGLAGLKLPAPGKIPVRRVKGALDQYKEWGLTGFESNALTIYTTGAYMALNRFLRGAMKSDDPDKLADVLTRLGGDAAYDALVTRATDHGQDAATIRANWVDWEAVVHGYLAAVTSALGKLPAPTEDVVSRGVALNSVSWLLMKHKQDELVADPAFMSTAFGTPFAKDSIIVIRLPPGHPGRKITMQSALGDNEAEIVFPPGSGYRIERILTRQVTPEPGEPGVQQAEFDHVMERLVPDVTERNERFGIVERIYFTELVAPKKAAPVEP